MSQAAEKKGMFKRVKTYFKEMRSEIKKVVWPTGKQVVNNTGVVIAAILLVGSFIWIFDFLLGTGLSVLLNL